MCGACDDVVRMPKMIQVRNVPDDLHRTLKGRAARAGMSLSDYLLRELRRVAEVPTIEDWLDRVHAEEPVTPSVSSADAVRAERDGR
jgi:hypothetical protein